jgi:hypothetical protein
MTTFIAAQSGNIEEYGLFGYSWGGGVLAMRAISSTSFARTDFLPGRFGDEEHAAARLSQAVRHTRAVREGRHHYSKSKGVPGRRGICARIDAYPRRMYKARGPVPRGGDLTLPHSTIRVRTILLTYMYVSLHPHAALSRTSSSRE